MYPPGFTKYDEAAVANSDVLRRWFKRLHITHVESTFGNSKTDEACIADGRYTAGEYLRWWKRAEEES